MDGGGLKIDDFRLLIACLAEESSSTALIQSRLKFQVMIDKCSKLIIG
jgi:hypothetical protein